MKNQRLPNCECAPNLTCGPCLKAATERPTFYTPDHRPPLGPKEHAYQRNDLVWGLSLAEQCRTRTPQSEAERS